MGQIKEKIRLATANGVMDKGLVLDAILNLISDEQLEQAPEFRLLGGFAPTPPVDRPSPEAIEASIRELVPDAVFADRADPNFIPNKCRKGEWRQLKFTNEKGVCNNILGISKKPLFLFTKDLMVLESPSFYKLMKSNGYTHIRQHPCKNGKWGVPGCFWLCRRL